MSQADQFAEVAEFLRRGASKVNDTSAQTQQVMSGLSGVAESVLLADVWSGQAPRAFQLFWSQAMQDGERIASAYNQSGSSMNALAGVIEANVPAMRSYEHMQQETPPPSSQPDQLAQFNQSLNAAGAASDAALAAIVAMAAAMTGELDAASQEIGFCSTGEGGTYYNKSEPSKPGSSPRKSAVPILQGLIAKALIGAIVSSIADMILHHRSVEQELPEFGITFLAGILTNGFGALTDLGQLITLADEVPGISGLLDTPIGDIADALWFHPWVRLAIQVIVGSSLPILVGHPDLIVDFIQFVEQHTSGHSKPAKTPTPTPGPAPQPIAHGRPRSNPTPSPVPGPAPSHP